MKNTKSLFGLLMTAVLTISLLSIPALAANSQPDTAAAPVQYTVSVDGKAISLWAYEVNGGMYFKLRDLATVLNDTDRQFEVSWDGTQNAVSLTTGTAYTPVGGELSMPLELSESSDDIGTAPYSPTTAFYVDQRQIPIRSYIISDAHYIMLSDLAANLMFAADCDEEAHSVKIVTDVYSSDLYTFSLPEGWRAGGDTYNLSFTRSGDPVGNLNVYNYYPDNPISQFQGNHAEMLSSEELSGFAYPAEKALIRRIQPAAANDNSYVDELHIYILLGDLNCAFDFCFDCAKVDEQTAMEIAKGFTPNEAAIGKSTVTANWAQAIQKRDGYAQYDLLSTELQAKFKDYYEAVNWVTGVSSPWVNSWTIEISGNRAVVFYLNETSTGFAGYTIDTLIFSEENGLLKISNIEGVNDFLG